MSEVKKPKATERVSAVEKNLISTQRRVGEMEMILFNLSRENEILKDALQLLHEKLESVIALSNEGRVLTADNINEKIVLIKEQSLKNKVENMVESGQLTSTDKVTQDSLIVARELNKQGEVENPRIQFLVGRLVEELQNKFLGKEVGYLVKSEDDKLDLEIMEIYNVTTEQISAQQQTEETGQTDQTDQLDQNQEDTQE